jgi:hypothetical protein
MTTTHRIGTSVALALALAAIATPAGARPFDLNANGSEVPAGPTSMQAASQPTQPNGVPPILSAAKRSQRATLQHAQQQDRLAYLAHHQPNGAKYSSSEMNAYGDATPSVLASTGPRSEVVSGGGYGPINTPATVVRVLAHDGGFDWGDAGIGAAGGLGLALVGLGGVFAISQQRQARRSKRSAAITS